jgi:hypothetical protein
VRRELHREAVGRHDRCGEPQINEARDPAVIGGIALYHAGQGAAVIQAAASCIDEVSLTAAFSSAAPKLWRGYQAYGADIKNISFQFSLSSLRSRVADEDYWLCAIRLTRSFRRGTKYIYFIFSVTKKNIDFLRLCLRSSIAGLAGRDRCNLPQLMSSP